jgi:hypothetical protein
MIAVDAHVHVVVPGSDYPFEMADPHPVRTVQAVGLGADVEHALLFGTAARECKLPIQARG